jgi:hypothetical protein
VTSLYEPQYRRERTALPIQSEADIPAAFGEATAASFRYMRDEGLSVSRGNAFSPFLDERDAAVESLAGERLTLPYGSLEEPWYPEAMELVASGELALDESRQVVPKSGRAKALASRISPEYLRAIAVREKLRSTYPDKILSDDQIAERVAETLKERRESNQATMSRGGVLPQFVGAMGGSLTDPAIIATLPIGAGWQGGRALVNAARAFGSEFVIGAGTEALVQGEVYDFKKAIESPYSKAEAVLNVLAAGVGAGLVRATAGAVFDAGIALKEALQVRGATKALIDAGIDPLIAGRILDELETRGATVPPGIDPLAHSAALDRAINQVDSGRLADVDPILQGARFAEDRATVVEAERFLNERIADLTGEAGNALDKGSRTALLAEVRQAERAVEAAQSEARLAELVQARREAGETGRKAKAGADKDQAAEVKTLRETVERLEKIVARDDKARAAGAELSRIEQAKAKDPVQAATKYGFKDPRPLRNAIREAIDNVRRQETKQADVPRMEAEAKARRIAETAEKPKVEKGAVPAPMRGSEPTVRVYHGGSPTDDVGDLWVTTSVDDAKGWASRGDGMRVWSIDVPRSLLGERVPGALGDPANGIPPLSRFELPADLAAGRKVFGETSADQVPDIAVGIGTREDGSIEAKSAREFIREIDDELAALDRVEACLLRGT